MPAKAGISEANKLDDQFANDPEIGQTPLLPKPCAACQGRMRTGEAHIQDTDGTLYHPEHYSAS